MMFTLLVYVFWCFFFFICFLGLLCVDLATLKTQNAQTDVTLPNSCCKLLHMEDLTVPFM